MDLIALSVGFVVLIIVLVLFQRPRYSGPRDVSKLPPLSESVKSLARDPGRKIEAIKMYREETGRGLAEAKDAVEAYMQTLK
jgi:hypothetical protein